MKHNFRRVLSMALVVAMILTTMLTGMSAPVQAASAPGNIDLAREVAAEGMVLMENRNEVLPIPKGETVAMFGRAMIDYVRGGGGSGNTNVEYTRNILQGMQWWEEEGQISLVPELTSFYTQQVTTNGITNDANITITDDVWNAAAAATETAVVTIGRYSSEGSDRSATKGDYYLSDAEVDLITRVAAEFDKTIVVLNVGAVLDTSWIKGENAIPGVDAVLMAWQAGMEGGLATADVLVGYVNPSGKFVDTFAKDYSDYPSSETFKESNSYVNYTEDIFVGYRYFETIPGAAERVNYEFGYGLSYTTFDTVVDSVEVVEDEIVVKATVTNTGDVAGKQVVQVYFTAPRGDLTKPIKELAAFDKTDLLAPGASETLTMSFPISDMSSYDDEGAIQESAYVMEAGDYTFFVGNSVRDGKYVDFVYTVEEDLIVEQLTELAAPTMLPKRMLEDGTYVDVATGGSLDPHHIVAAEGQTKVEMEAYYDGIDALRVESFYGDDFERMSCLAYMQKQNDWVEYELTAEADGQYAVYICYANGYADKMNSLNVTVDGVAQTEAVFNAIQTGDGSGASEWYNFRMTEEPMYINLKAGVNIVRLTAKAASMPNFDYMILERVGEYDGAYVRKLSATGINKIEAETYDASIVGRPNSEGKTYPVRVEDFTYADGSAAQCLAYMNYRGNGVEYCIHVEQAGQYELVLNGANGRAAFDFRPLIRVQAEDGTNVLYRQAITAERTCGGDETVEGLPSGWYGFADLEPIYVDLPAGNVILSINAQAAAFVNVDYFTLEKVGEYNAPGITVSATTTVVEAEDYTDAGWPQSKYPNVTETAPETAGAFAGTVCTAHVNYPGNYLSWYLNAEKAGTYTVTLNVANGYEDYIFAPKATINGKEFPVSIEIPSTRDDGEGGTGNRYYNFMDAPSFTVELEEGMNVFTLECVTQDVFPNLNSLTFTKLSDNPIVSAEGITKIEAEAYTTTNPDNAAKTESFTDRGYSGQSIGMASRGRYVTYDLYVEEAGIYELALRASNGYATYDLNPGIIVNGKAYPQFVEMVQTCSGGAANPDVPTGWFTFEDVPAAAVELPAGEITLTLLCGNTAGTSIRYPNVDYFTLKKVSDESIDRAVTVDGSATVEAEAYTATSLSDAVVIQAFGENEKCLAYMNYAGAYVDYELNVTEPGIYNVALVTSYGYDDTDFMPAIQILHEDAPDANWNMITCKRTCLGEKTAEDYPGYPAGWHTFEELEPLTLALPEGKCTLRLECTNAKYPNVDCIKLEKVAEYAAPYHAVSGEGETVIPAIDFNATSRTDDYPVRIEKITAGDLTGEYCLCFMNYPGNAVTYYLYAEQAGSYNLTLNAANGYDAYDDFRPNIVINGESVDATLTVPATKVDGNRWYNFVDLEPVTVELEQGLNVLTMTCDTRDKFPNLSYITISPVSEPAPAKLAMVKSASKSAAAAAADEGPIMLIDVYNGDATMEAFLDQLSLEDLANLLSARGNRDGGNTQGWGNIMEYGIPLVMTADGPQGIRISNKCTAWPISTCLSSSWDVDVVAAVGKAAATEAHNNNMDIWLAPGMNIHRDPLCGRNFEYYSEDPLVTGKMAASITRAVQNEGVAISLKHFAANNKETNRSSSDSRLSERALREIYLRGFEIAVKEADPWTIMSSYNFINGIETAENYDLLTGIARNEWGFDGVFETDWGNNSNHVMEVLAGNDVKMTNSQPEKLVAAVEAGKLTREHLETGAERVLRLIMKVNYFQDRFVNIPIVEIGSTTTLKAAENILWSETIQTEATSDTDGGNNVGYCDAGAYAQYEINVLTGGTYNLMARVASSAGNGAFNMLIDGEVVASFDVPNTGAYQNWTTISSVEAAPVELTAGRHTLRFEWTEAGSNLNWMSFALQTPSGDDNEDPDDKIDSEELAAAVKAAEDAQAAAEAAQAAAEAAQAEAEAAKAEAEAAKAEAEAAKTAAAEAAASAAEDKSAAEAAKAAAEQAADRAEAAQTEAEAAQAEAEAAKDEAEAAKTAAETAKTQAQVAAEAAAASNTAAAAEAVKAAEEAAEAAEEAAKAAEEAAKAAAEAGKAAASATAAAGSAADAAEAAEAAQTAQAAAEAAQAAAEEAAASAAEDKAAAETAQAAAELAKGQAEAAKAAAEDAKAAADASAKAAEASNTAAAEEAAKAAEEAKNAAASASTAAGSAADAAEAAENAQTAQAAAEAAQAAAEEAAASAAEDKTAAEAAQAAAELAQEQAEAAQAAAEAAQTSAEASAEAAANSNAEAAAQAAVATAEAKKAAASATAAAGSAADAAEAAENAQTAQEAAEAAQAAAEEAAASSADNKTAAEAAQANAELAKAQAVAAKTATETAQNAAEIAAAAAKEANVEAAEEAAKAAASAKDSAENASAAAGYAKEAADAAKASQDAQAAAEEAAKAAAADKAEAERAKEEALRAEEEAKKAAAEAALNLAKYDALVELNELSAAMQATATPEEVAALIEATAAARAAIKEAAAVEAVEAALAEAKTALEAALCPADAFSDVDMDAWYHDAVDFVLKEGMMQGTGNGLFAPDAALSRAMLVQILYNIEGKPAYETELTFSDVAEGAWYYDAVMWAAENGIVEGTGNGLFAPDANVTREQMVTILYRYAKSPEVKEAELSFADAAEVSDWAAAAVAWAAENGVVQGVGDNKFAPKDNTTRAATAQVCMNYFGK